MGVSLCYHLAKAGWTDVVLLEKNDLTHGSTWHAAGLCTHFAHNATIQALRARSVKLYRDILPEATGESCGFHPSGAMRITRCADRMDEFKHVAGLSAFTGYPLEVLTPERIRELYPLAQLDGLIGGIYEPEDGHVDPTLATQAMAKLAVQYGARIARYNPVLGIRREQSRWLLETGDGIISSRHIVNAAGTWGYEVGRMMGLDIPTVPVLHQYLVTDSVPDITARELAGTPELPIIRDPEESWYVRQERDGFILGPYEKEAQVWSVDQVPPDFGAELLAPDLERLEPIIEAAMQRIPALADAGVKSVVNGPITFTPDANPLIGPAHGLSNAWLLTGSSMGVMEGGGAGWFLAHWMTTGSPPLDALSIDSRRFGRWADRDYRVNKAIECFGLQFGIHFPYEERTVARNKRRSPLHDAMLQRGAVMGAAYGWERPNWFSSKKGDRAVESFQRTNWFEAVASEVHTTTTAVAVADLSVFSKFEVTGSQAKRFIDSLGANRAPAIGRIGLLHVLTPAGGVLAEFSVSMLTADKAYLTSAAAAEEINFDLLLERAAAYNVAVSNVTDSLAVIGVMGPYARDTLNALVAPESKLFGSDFRWLDCKTVSIAGHDAVALRVSYVGESGWELHVPVTAALELLLAIERSGKPYGLGYYGAYAANSMRLEKGYRAWGADLTTERTPAESGVGQFVNSVNRSFAGSEAMQVREQAADAWQHVLLAIDCAHTDAFYSHPVQCDDRIVGIVTSGAYGHRCGQSLALAYLQEPLSAREKVSLTVLILGVSYTAEILDQPPFDPQNERLKS
ncbi:dimethylglycine dehydrogenase [Chromatiales bacterium (ex Bugula neritina AB1)]|nr:dimethylglycine dehydrogenase [Chromatiales bacterium (ex Bugula neritina AB1)]